MSSRALRRLQREQEAEKIRQREEQSDDDGEYEEEEPHFPQQQMKKSAFDLLNDAADEEDKGEDSVQQDDEDDDDDTNDVVASEPTAPTERASGQGGAASSSKKSKKKKKSKAKISSKPVETVVAGNEMDEIDLALKSLGTTTASKGKSGNLVIDQELQRFYSLLGIDKQHMNPLNEMKKLFGSVVLEREDDEEVAQRRQRTNQGIAISDFLSAKYSRVSRGQGLSGLALRQNALLPGKPEWPKAASGGLGMELVERADDFTTEYRFQHNLMYQRVQREFERAVLTMDPQAMFQMVYNNPYHISSLLQTAEILKHQGDHSVAADMYERALYSFGRSIQSSFASDLSEGKARLDFRRPENREFWLTGYRYIGALIQKGTFRTAYEWAKLLLSLDPEGDPYCIRLIIDQLALRGGQSEHLINLAGTKSQLVDWGQGSPNIQISLALAHYRAKRLDEARDSLAIAVKDYPWIFARLFQLLDIEQTPKAIWGVQPRSDVEKFHTESYAARAKDVWNMPETLSFLKEVVLPLDKSEPPKPDTRPITLDEARHALVSEISSLIGTVPREYTTMRTTASDPLPPADSKIEYDPTGSTEDLESDEEIDDRDMDQIIERARTAAAGQNGAGANGIMGLLGRALNMFTGRGTAPGEAPEGPEASLGAQMGMEEVRVSTVQEYEDALNRGQWPVLDETAAPEIMRELERQETSRRQQQRQQHQQHQQQQQQPPGATTSRDADNQAREQQRQQDEARIREAQSRRQATVEEEEEDLENTTDTQQAPVTQRAMGNMTREEIRSSLQRDYDNDANKRWLAGRGMLALKSFVEENGADEARWGSDPRVDKAPLTEYLARTSLLRSTSDKNFIIEYALKQGAGSSASDLVKRLL